MRIFVIAFAVIAAASAASISSEYLPPVGDNSLPSPGQEYLAPAVSESSETSVADDGYRYKTVRKLKLRHRRDVNELPANEYLPPNQEVSAVSVAAVAVEAPVEAPQEEASAPEAVEVAEEKTVLADDGYRYKTVRRIRYRQRRDVSELSPSYLPPNQEASAASEEAIAVEAPVEAPQEEASAPVAVEAPEEKTVLADDGYHYKTVRRIRYRHRRDVSELSPSYLPPNQEASAAASEEAVVVEAPVEAPVQAAPQEEASAPEEQTVLADDGYRYKTVRRIRYRQRRDVSELPANEYLPPNQEASVASGAVIAVEAAVETPQEESSAPVAVEAAEEKTVLADDGYRYKTVRRIRYRQRRDVNELPANEYLPPSQEASAASVEAVAVEAPVEAPQEEASAPIAVQAAEEKTVLADDGYQYKTVRRIRYRHRRDVNELPANEYLPPSQEASAASEAAIAVEAPVEVPQEEASAPVAIEEPEEKTVLADDGYRYKTVRRIRYRQRRDVNELPANEYLPPSQEASAASVEAVAVEAPVEASQEEATAPVAVEAPEEETVLADDGYQYKTVRRIRYRQRRDVNELPANEYLPPSQEASVASEVAVAVEAPVEAPQEEASAPIAIEAPEEKTVLADDGYRYKTVRRIRYRQRRDVNELPANEYLPPSQEASAASVEAVAVEAPVQAPQEEASAPIAVQAAEEKTVLGDDGYQYKTVRRIRYRHRRDVNELPANEYLPPSQEASAASEAAIAVEAPVEAPQEEASAPIAVQAAEEKTVLADDGYQYKTVRRIRYRQRRDVNELPANEYLPPSQEASAASVEAIAVEAPVEAPQEEASAPIAVQAAEENTVLADDGYRYKTVRRIRYRQRRDVNELPAKEYLPPNQEASAVSVEAVAVEAPVEAPQEEASAPVAIEAPEEKTVLADDGYQYKTVRRIRYRQRRDVNELPANEYLPPSQEASVASEVAVAVEAPVEAAPQEEASAPEEKTVLADDGYRYKTVRRIKYRRH